MKGETVLSFIVGCVISALVLASMSLSFEDELAEQELYCKMVSEGTWGDYNDNYSEVCLDRDAD